MITGGFTCVAVLMRMICRLLSLDLYACNMEASSEWPVSYYRRPTHNNTLNPGHCAIVGVESRPAKYF